MEHDLGRCWCDICEQQVDYHALVSDESNKVEWLACGHVIITQDDTVVHVHSYAKQRRPNMKYLEETLKFVLVVCLAWMIAIGILIQA